MNQRAKVQSPPLELGIGLCRRSYLLVLMIKGEQIGFPVGYLFEANGNSNMKTKTQTDEMHRK